MRRTCIQIMCSFIPFTVPDTTKQVQATKPACGVFPACGVGRQGGCGCYTSSMEVSQKESSRSKWRASTKHSRGRGRGGRGQGRGVSSHGATALDLESNYDRCELIKTRSTYSSWHYTSPGCYGEAPTPHLTAALPCLSHSCCHFRYLGSDEEGSSEVDDGLPVRQSQGADLQQLLAESEQFYAQAHFRFRSFTEAVDTEPPPVDVAALEEVCAKLTVLTVVCKGTQQA